MFLKGLLLPALIPSTTVAFAPGWRSLCVLILLWAVALFFLWDHAYEADYGNGLAQVWALASVQVAAISVACGAVSAALALSVFKGMSRGITIAVRAIGVLARLVFLLILTVVLSAQSA